MTVNQACRDIDSFREFTGKFAECYVCGPQTYINLLWACGITDPSKIDQDKVYFRGARLITTPLTPEGKLYPSNYIEGVVA